MGVIPKGVVGHGVSKTVVCKQCKTTLNYEDGEAYETFEGTGPFEVECPRVCIRCPQCKANVDIP